MVAKLQRRYFAVKHDSLYLPFLYLTRTLTTSQVHDFSSAPRLFRPTHSCRYSTQHQPARKSAPEGCSSSEETSSHLGVTGDVTHGRRTKSPPSINRTGSTITPAERHAFQNILRKGGRDGSRSQVRRSRNPLKKSRGPNNVKPMNPITGARVTESLDIEDNFQDDIHDILSSSASKMRESGGPRPAISGRMDAGPEVQERDITESQGPGAGTEAVSVGLMKAYRKLRAFEQDERDPESPDRDMAGVDTFHAASIVALREAKKICDAMDEAVEAGKGDIGIWTVCESRVFSMLDLVDLEEAASAELAPPEADRSAKALDAENMNQDELEGLLPSETQEKSVAESTSSALDIPPNIPALRVVSEVYPKTLLHALRLLHVHFPLSPFVTQLPETVKDRSRLSYIMGASTTFYNERMSFRWHAYYDVAHVTSLLEEMDVSGVPFNQQTLDILEDIRSQRAEAREAVRRRGREGGEGQPPGTVWWLDTEASRKAFRQILGPRGREGWMTKIRNQLKQQ